MVCHITLKAFREKCFFVSFFAQKDDLFLPPYLG